MTDETPNPTTPEPDPAPTSTARRGRERPPSSGDTQANRPEYKGAELDPERGPGLGCFWFQVLVLGFFIVLIPIGLNLNWPYEVLALLLFVVIGLLLLTGQTVIFLLRLVAADRRVQGRRRPLASPTKTVGELEDEHRVAHAVGSARPVGPVPPARATRRRAARAATSEAFEPEAAAPARAPEAMIRDQEGRETPAPADQAPESGAVSVRDVDQTNAGAVVTGVDGGAGASAGPPEGGAAPAGDGAGEREEPRASRTHESLPGGRRTRRARATAADSPATAAADAPAAGAPVPPEGSAPASSDVAGPGEPPEEPDPGVRQ